MSVILVTGAAGFLGSHIAEYHLDIGDKVIGIDDHSTSLGPNSTHLKRLKQKGMPLIESSIETSVFERLDVKPDIVYNFACPASPPRYQAIPMKTLQTCFQGTSNVLKFAASKGSTILHASTSEVYGDPELSPQPESYRGCVNTWGPRANYDEGKRVAETLCYEYLNAGVDVRVVRIFNTYGPHMDPDDGRVISNFICQALRGEKLTVYGDGTQSRSFCYCSDLIRAITTYGRCETNLMQPVNIGNPTEFTIGHLANLVNKAVGNKAGVVYKDLPVDDPLQRCPNIELAQSALGWTPYIDINVGLVSTIEYFKAMLK